MRNLYNVILLFPLVAFLSGCQDTIGPVDGGGFEEKEYPNRFYIDEENGMYYNTGHSPSEAWESVDRINERIWNPGDTILIKRGTVYNGVLKLKGNGTAEAPIVICSYGDESLPLPVIAAGGQSEAILVRNIQYWEIHDIHVTNKGEAPLPKAAGIRIVAENIEGGVMNHIHVKRCVISDVFGSKTTYEGGGAGIFYYNAVDTQTPSCFNDLVVEGCRISNCQRDGINGYIATGDRSSRKASTGVVFRDNIIEGVPGDQILVNGCDNALVEGNIVRNCAEGGFADESIPNRMEAAAAIWCMHSDGTVFRYNIVQDHKATWDGQAFDCDQNCQNTLFEYNISYNNVGGWIMMCPSDASFSQGFAEHKGTVVRYNISINDGTRDYLKGNGKAHSTTIDIVGRVADCHFYNNTVIKTKSASENADNTAIGFDNYTNIENSLRFTNNIFYNTTGTANAFVKITSGDFVDDMGLVLRNNCIYGYEEGSVPGDVEHNVGTLYSDPQFVSLVEDFIDNGNIVDKDEILAGLSLSSASPCLGNGLVINDDIFPAGNDFWGMPAGQMWNIGAYNH